MAVNCSMPAFTQHGREVVGHSYANGAKLPKDQRYELHEERDGLKSLKVGRLLKTSTERMLDIIPSYIAILTLKT